MQTPESVSNPTTSSFPRPSELELHTFSSTCADVSSPGIQQDRRRLPRSSVSPVLSDMMVHTGTYDTQLCKESPSWDRPWLVLRNFLKFMCGFVFAGG